MAERSGLFSGGTMTADDFANMIRAITTSGVANGVLNGLAPTQGPGLGFTIDTGSGVVNGEPYTSDSAVAKAFATNVGGGAARVDVGVLRMNKTSPPVYWGNTPPNSVRIDVHQGTPGAGIPTLLTTSTQYEIALCRATISTADVISAFTDMRANAGPGLHDIVTGHSPTTWVKNTGLFGPASGADAAPSRRALVNMDIPGCPYATVNPLGDRAAAGECIQRGTVSGTILSGTKGITAGITYPIAFTAPPIVLLTINTTNLTFPGELPASVGITSPLAASCVAQIVANANVGADRAVTVHWLAIGVPVS
jgi:hypothetical protein